jgi:hypothetical protein
MDNLMIYQPSSTSAKSLFVPEENFASLQALRPVSQLRQQNDMWTEQSIKSRGDVSDTFQQTQPLDQLSRYDPRREEGTCPNIVVRDIC